MKQFVILQLCHFTNQAQGAVLLQTCSEITEKEQLLCNTHNVTICHITIMPFHQLGTGGQKKIKLFKFHPEIDTSYFV